MILHTYANFQLPITGFLEQLPKPEDRYQVRDRKSGMSPCGHRTAVHKPEQITDWTDLPNVASSQAEYDAKPSQPEVPILGRSTHVSVPTQRYSPGDFHA